MRKMMIMALLAATAAPIVAPAAASAQSHELRRDREQLREERQELRDARRHGDWRDVREERRDVAEARRDLRQDRRDWREYRRDNRNVYARGNWRAPFRYNAWNVGVRLQPTYYSSRYYVNDWNRYRLPRPAYGLRYIRHYDDVLLVNVRTGRVVQVYRSFFW